MSIINDFFLNDAEIDTAFANLQLYSNLYCLTMQLVLFVLLFTLYLSLNLILYLTMN